MEVQLESMIENIIQEVLRRMGNDQEAAIVEGLDYSGEVLEQLNRRYRVRKINFEEIHELPCDVDVFIPALKLSQMMAVYSGIPCDVLSEVTMLILLQGINVHVFAEQMQMKSIKMVNTPYASAFKKAYSCLLESGLVIVDERVRKIDAACGGRLFTEKDAMKCVENGMSQVVLSKDAIVTPLASDFARHNNLTIERA